MTDTQTLKKASSPSESIVVVGILFTAFLILSNLTAFKLALIGSTTITAGIIFFPVTYVFDDILTEVYGFKVSRRVIWTALFTHIAFMYTIPYIEVWKISFIEYVLKVGYEVLTIPITYKICNYLKRKDNVDHYDYNTKFNPFSFAID